MIRRFLKYAHKHGFAATVDRMLLSVKRTLRGNRLVLFYCHLDDCVSTSWAGSVCANIERINRECEVKPRDLRQIIEDWNPSLKRRQVVGRFSLGASLWLYKVDGRVAGYGWTLAGQTVEPHFYPVCAKDLHLFDFFVFPQYRGKRINVFLVNHILTEMSQEGIRRAFIEAHEWNSEQLASISRMPFVKLGCARKFQLFGNSIVVWSNKTTGVHPLKY